MFARGILTVLAIASIILLFYGFTEDQFYAALAIPFVIAFATVYVMSPQINWWYYDKYPPRLDKRLGFMINQQSAFYQQLGEDDKARFRTRLAMCMMGHDFMPMVIESVPEDLKGALAASIIHLTFGQEDYLLEHKFEKIIIYPTAFPSPQFPEEFHSSEIYPPDGVMMFSAEHLLKGFAQPHLYYNSGMHEAVQAYLYLYPDKNYPVLEDDIWEKLELISNFSKVAIKEWIGLEEVNPMAVAMCHFLMFPKRFWEILPETAEQFKKVLNY